MQRLILILTLLFVSVLTTACINNFAIQELNNKAKEYMDNGEINKAICRYKSSLDLDKEVFETNYNLGVAYLSIQKYNDAIEYLNIAQKIDLENSGVYYSLAVAQESIAYNKINGKIVTYFDDEVCNGLSVVKNKENNASNDSKGKQLSDEEKEEVGDLLAYSIENYNQYLALSPDAEDKESIISKISLLNEELKKYSVSEDNDISVKD